MFRTKNPNNYVLWSLYQFLVNWALAKLLFLGYIANVPGAHPISARALAMHCACVRSDALLLNHASSEDGTWTHGSVASRPIAWQRETQGRSPFLRASSRYATCMSAGLRVRGDVRMLVPAKQHNELGWDLVSQIDCIAKLRIIE